METCLTDVGHVMPTYGRKEVCFTNGEGIWLTTDQNEKYMDFVSGVAVNCLGHSSPIIMNALREQANQLIHVSNLYWNMPQLRLAKKLISLGKGNLKDVFFCNSGAEALEGALKLCKKYGQQVQKPYIVYMENSFHGRTSGALSITGQQKYQEPFGELIPECISTPFNDLEALKTLCAKYAGKIAAVFIEPIQGEGGVIQVEESFLEYIEDYCKNEEALLVFDEVQCGAGRLGTFYAYESFKVTPDIVCMAKGLGGGVPIGAVLANAKASVFEKGDHGSTYGGNPLVCSVALAVVETISDPSFLEGVIQKGKVLSEGLEQLKQKGLIEDYRGVGLLQGIVVESPAKVVDESFKNKLLLIGAGSDTVRLLPPLNVQDGEIKQMLTCLEINLTNLVSKG